MSVMRKLVTSVALAAPMVLAAPMAAHATDVAVVAGLGTITPGLPCTGCTIDFNFNAVDAGTLGTGLYTGCNFNGTSGAETELGGAGAGTLSGCGISGNVTYSRTAVVVTVAGTVTLNSNSAAIGANALIFIPTSALPTTSFIVVGAVEIG